MIVRPALPQDAEAVAAIVYESAPRIYDRLVGQRDGAISLLQAAFAREGTDASAEVITVVELDTRVAAVLSSFPAVEAGRRGAAFVSLLLGRSAPWRWPRILAYIHRGRRAALPPPRESLYVDALATHQAMRRRGAARALLDAAEERAHRLGLRQIALDTEQANAPARALYESEGYVARATGPEVRDLPVFVLYVKQL